VSTVPVVQEFQKAGASLQANRGELPVHQAASLSHPLLHLLVLSEMQLVDEQKKRNVAHFAGLVAAGLHPSPVPHAHVVTTTIHKTIGGGRGGMILCRDEHAKAINSAVFPGQQGGPLEHVIAAKAVALRIAMSAAFRERQERTLAGARAVASELLRAEHRVEEKL